MHTGMDVQFKDFKRSMWGYDIDEVKSYLDELSKHIEVMSYENKVLKDKLREKDLLLIDYKDRESTLKDTMLTAQKVTEGIKKEATKEAENFVRQAQLKADSIVRDALERMRKTLDETNRLKKQKVELISNIKTFLESHLRMVERYEGTDDDVLEFDFKTKTLKVPKSLEIIE